MRLQPCSFRGVVSSLLIATACLTSPPLGAQSRDQGEDTPNEVPLPPPRPLGAKDGVFSVPRPGAVPNALMGQAGQRQNKLAVAGVVVPAARLDTRIANRVQTRLSNRIDRYYDPQANAVSPFAVASEQVKRQRQAPRY